MGMRIHELHPSLIHAPLTLLPAASLVDLWAASRRDDVRVEDRDDGLAGVLEVRPGDMRQEELNLEERPVI